MEPSEAIAQTCALSPPPPGWLDRIWGAGPPSPCGEPGPARSLRRLPAAVGGAPWAPPPPSSRPCSACWGRSWGPVEVAAAVCRVRPRPLWGTVGEDDWGDGVGADREAPMVLGSWPELSSGYLSVRLKELPGK